MRIYAFEKLLVWQEARELIKLIYLYTKAFPKEEIYGLTSQVRRAAISIASNIAEGSGRSNEKEQLQFYRMAYSSLMEVLNQLIISTDLKYLDEASMNNELRPRIESISSKLYSLKKKS